jgi:hypothetical protein
VFPHCRHFLFLFVTTKVPRKVQVETSVVVLSKICKNLNFWFLTATLTATSGPVKFFFVQAKRVGVPTWSTGFSRKMSEFRLLEELNPEPFDRRKF